MRLSQLLEEIGDVPAGLDRPIAGLSLDSRDLPPGGLFLACQGSGMHGLDHLAGAIERGAAAVVAEPGRDWHPSRIAELELPCPLIQVSGLRGLASEVAGRFYGHPSERMRVIGITGTNGKTSCTRFLAEALGEREPCGVIGTLGYGIRDQWSPGTHTTPDAVGLQAILQGLLEQDAAAVAMEVSSHALDQQRAAAVRFDTAAFTNLSQDHLDYHGSMEAYGDSKRRLFEMAGLRCAAVNHDDPFGRELLAGLGAGAGSGALTLAYGLAPIPMSGRGGPDGALWAKSVEGSAQGMRILVDGSWGEGELTTPLLGRFNASNLLLVLTLLLERGVPMWEAVERLAGLQIVPGRMERFGGEETPLVVVDYAHTPDALEQALKALKPHTAGRLICLFGCGGERDRGKRPLMGAIAERLADLAILTDDNPRREDGAEIIREIREGLERPGSVPVERDRARAIAMAVGGARIGDVVLVAGKGHEAYQQVGELKLPFSDAEQVRRALAEWQSNNVNRE